MAVAGCLDWAGKVKGKTQHTVTQVQREKTQVSAGELGLRWKVDGRAGGDMVGLQSWGMHVSEGGTHQAGRAAEGCRVGRESEAMRWSRGAGRA